MLIDDGFYISSESPKDDSVIWQVMLHNKSGYTPYKVVKMKSGEIVEYAMYLSEFSKRRTFSSDEEFERHQIEDYNELISRYKGEVKKEALDLMDMENGCSRWIYYQKTGSFLPRYVFKSNDLDETGNIVKVYKEDNEGTYRFIVEIDGFADVIAALGELVKKHYPKWSSK